MQRRLEELRRFSNLESEREGKSVKEEKVGSRGCEDRAEEKKRRRRRKKKKMMRESFIRVSHLRPPALCRYCKPRLGNDTRRYIIHKIRARIAYTRRFYYLIVDSFSYRRIYSFLRLFQNVFVLINLLTSVYLRESESLVCRILPQFNGMFHYGISTIRYRLFVRLFGQ